MATIGALKRSHPEDNVILWHKQK